jgi:GNAT superfamily N-acetyltransferase
MIEIRPILAKEADEFLRLLCHVFELDYGRAKDIFYSEPLFDLQRKWGLFKHEKLVSILTTVPLEFGSLRAIGIAGVATLPEERGNGLARRLLNEVVERAYHRGETGALLFATRKEMYEQAGFEGLDVVERAVVASRADLPDSLVTLEQARVEQVYAHWASQHPMRLRRDARRWKYWSWNFRMCRSFGSGYLCVEPSLFREGVVMEPAQTWPVDPGTEWFGLRSMRRDLGVSVLNPRTELFLMGRGFDQTPQMFMTDQF